MVYFSEVYNEEFFKSKITNYHILDPIELKLSSNDSKEAKLANKLTLSYQIKLANQNKKENFIYILYTSDPDDVINLFDQDFDFGLILEEKTHDYNSNLYKKIISIK
jgi:hypothetical protein